MTIRFFIKSNSKTIISIIVIVGFVYLMRAYNIDARAIAIITFLLSYITNAFVGIIAILELMPVIGPMIIKIFTIPFFWLINGVGYLTSAYAIKKGYRRVIISHRIITTTLLIGVILGYILGHLIPVI